MTKPLKQYTPDSTKNNNLENSTQFNNPWKIVKQWYRTDLGHELFKTEKNILEKQLVNFFGYNLVQLGNLDVLNDSLIANSKISNQFIFESIARTDKVSQSTNVNSCFDELPLLNNSIDLMILPHTLEFEEYPHQILREVERVLMPEGKLVLFTFNPFSLWGLWHKYWQIKSQVKSEYRENIPLPSCGHLISQNRLKDWLQLLGFDVETIQGYFFRPPLQNMGILNQLEFIEKAGKVSRLIPAGGYMMVATKRVSTLTPIRQPWKLSRTVMGSKVPEQAGSGFKANDMKNKKQEYKKEHDK